MSSIIKNYRTLQGDSISIGIEQKIICMENPAPKENIEEQKRIDVKRIEEEARKEAQRILSEAQMQADVILEEASIQKEHLLSTCKEEIQSLKEEASNQIALDRDTSSAKAKQIIEEAYIQKQKILEETEPELVEILTSLLQTIVDSKLVSGIEWLTLLVKRMIEKEHLQEGIKVHVSTKLYELYRHEIESAFKDLTLTIEVIPNSHIEETRCLVETEVGSINYDVHKGLHKVLDEIKILSAV